MIDPTPTQCPAVGALVVGGRQVGWLRCSLELGHELSHDDVCHCGTGLDDHANETHNPVPGPVGTPHRQVLEWADDEAIDWPEAYDPDETFDVDIPFEPTLEDTQPMCGARNAGIDRVTCALPAGHDCWHDSDPGPFGKTWPTTARDTPTGGWLAERARTGTCPCAACVMHREL